MNIRTVTSQKETTYGTLDVVLHEGHKGAVLHHTSISSARASI